MRKSAAVLKLLPLLFILFFSNNFLLIPYLTTKLSLLRYFLYTCNCDVVSVIGKNIQSEAWSWSISYCVGYMHFSNNNNNNSYRKKTNYLYIWVVILVLISSLGGLHFRFLFVTAIQKCFGLHYWRKNEHIDTCLDSPSE